MTQRVTIHDPALILVRPPDDRAQLAGRFEVSRELNPWIDTTRFPMVQVTEVGGLPMSAPIVARNDSWSMHDAFDAEVGVTVAETGLYLVAAHHRDDGANAMRRSLFEVGAQLVAGMSDHKVLAVMTFAGFQTLRARSTIRLIGPVALDAERFSHFQSLIGAKADT